MTIPDLPDNYPYLPGSERYPLADLGELCARLGSPITYDRRGEVLWFDTFRHGLTPWKIVTSDGNQLAKITAETCMYDGFSLHMETDGTENAYVVAQRYFTPPVETSWGLEVSYNPTTAFDSLRLVIDYHDGSNHYGAYMMFDRANSCMKVLDADGNWQEVGDFTMNVFYANQFNRIKLVGDFQTKKYVRLLHSQRSYDISDHGIRGLGSGNSPVIKTEVYFWGATGATSKCYIDAVIFTANEP